MIQYQRQREILSMLEAEQAISIRRLAKDLFASESTVRRDLNTLEQMGLVRRVYGGVILARCSGTDMPAMHREQEHRAQKQEIAAQAAQLVRDGMSLFLDAATTTVCMVPYLRGYQNLTVVTNSLLITQKLGEQGDSSMRILCTGGQYIPQNMAFGGPAALRMIASVRADLLFFSSRGISLDGEITDTSALETEVRQAMLSRAQQRIFLCHDEKIGQQYVFKLCDRSGYDKIICNAPLPPQLTD